MPSMSDAEFERQAVLHAMGALGAKETARFEAERARRGAQGEQLEHGVREALERAGGGSRGVALSEREALAAVTAPLQGPRPWGWITAVAVLALASATAVVWGLSERSRAGREAEAARVNAGEADSLRVALDRMEAALPGWLRPGELAPFLAESALILVPLAGAGEAQGRVLASEDSGVLFVASGLAPLGSGTYHLWRRAGQITESVAELGDAPQGFLFARFTDAGFLEGAQSLLVTAEPGPGAVFPTQPAVLEGRLLR